MDNQTATPWYKLAVVQRLALSITLHLLAFTPLAKDIAGAELSPLVNDALNAIGLALDSWALHARVTKPCPPIAASKTAADAANASIQSTSSENISAKP